MSENDSAQTGTLADYGIEKQSIVRKPASSRDNAGDPIKICPECGDPVGASKGTQIIRVPEVVDDDLADALEERNAKLITHGWKCDRHTYDVILPNTTSRNATNFVSGWTGVELVFADGRTDFVPVPAKEVGHE